MFGVHAVRPREICATQYLTTDQADAERYAQAMSGDEGVLAAAVTRYVVGALGHTRAAALFVDGVRQRVPYVSDDRRINANGHGSASAYAAR